MIPVSPLYPNAFDSESNLYLVHDSLRVTLVDDYLPGDTTITIVGDNSRFPPTGLITLTEQQSPIDLRALSFFYNARDSTTFSGLELLPEFQDVPKPKNLTHVTQNVMAQHHNNLKDALIAIEEFIGIKGTVDLKPLGPTMEGRINFLRQLVLRPRAWFTATPRIGIVPLTVTFDDLSFRNPLSWCWNFGDSATCSTYSTSVVSTISNLVISNATDHVIEKTYFTPGIYDVTLTVSNPYGSDTITIPDYVVARVQAPDPATLAFAPNNATQALINGVLRTRINSLVNVSVATTGAQPLDPVTDYVWDMQDDLTHSDAPTTVASYSIGGLYDVRLRLETLLGAYRITIFPDVIDVIERTNVWYLVSTDVDPDDVTKNFSAYEFGLISETFKLTTRTTQSVTRDFTLVDGDPNGAQKAQEFKRNNGFVGKNATDSGDLGTAVAYWTEGFVGGQLSVRFREYVGFTDTWSVPANVDAMPRGWNWVNFNASAQIYFVLGSDAYLTPGTPGNSPTNQLRRSVSLSTYSFADVTFGLGNYLNGAQELMQNVGGSAAGDFCVYRSCWQGTTGFLARNDGVGSYFRIKSFYHTEGTLTELFQYFRKLPDMPGSQKLEGELVPLSGGIYFFNNTGEFLVWNDSASVWTIGGPGIGSAPFRSLQDQTVPDFDDPANTLVATSDDDHKAYLSFDYSSNAFIKFNEVTLTFSNFATGRPPGDQLLMGVY